MPLHRTLRCCAYCLIDMRGAHKKMRTVHGLHRIVFHSANDGARRKNKTFCAATFLWEPGL
jgi:hypothetical protein